MMWNGGRGVCGSRSGRHAPHSGCRSPTMSGPRSWTICGMDGPPWPYADSACRSEVGRHPSIGSCFFDTGHQSAWSKRSGLAIPFQGAHCLRHSYAVHLLRSGISLKTIGDLLGHRTLESTCVYLRLAVEDLRDVALDLPADVAADVTEVAS